MAIIIQEGGWMALQKGISQFAQDSCRTCSGKEKSEPGFPKLMERLESTAKGPLRNGEKPSLAKKIFLFVLKNTVDQKNPLPTAVNALSGSM